MFRKEMLKRAIGALALLGSLAITPPAGAASQVEESALPKAGASAAALTSSAAVRAPDCANVRSQITSLQQRAKKPGTGMVNCVSPSRSTAIPSDASRAAAADFCPGSAILQRLKSCTNLAGRAVVFTVPDGVVIGTSDYVVTTEVVLDSRSDRWRHNYNITFTSSWGAVKDLTVAGNGVCIFECVPVGGTFAAGSAVAPASHSGTATFDSTFHGINAVWTAGSAWTWKFTCPTCIPPESNPLTVESPRHRCDTKFANKPTGCVYREVIPTHEIGRLRYPKYAQHVDLAIRYGLPSVLRKVDQETADRNGRIACPPDDGALYKRPPGFSCDEYPFRSAKQGASEQPYGRTFFIFIFQTGNLIIDCKVKWLTARATNDSGGYSVCMVPADENSGGGSDLGVFYYDNRVIEGDDFRVRVV